MMSETVKNKTFRIKSDGFYGEMFRPAQDEYPGKVLICFGGSDGNFELSRMLAAVFQDHGLTALALANGACIKLKRAQSNPVLKRFRVQGAFLKSPLVAPAGAKYPSRLT